jgi:hypothetical protein
MISILIAEIRDSTRRATERHGISSKKNFNAEIAEEKRREKK